MEDAVLEAMGSARSMRWFAEDPVEPVLLERLIWAATRAASPNNTQHWDFVVVTDAELKAEIQAAIIAASPASAATGARPLPDDPVERRTAQGAANLRASLAQIPSLIFVCGENLYPTPPILEWTWSAMHAAAQNILVAARAMGLGAAFTTLHGRAEPEIKKILGIPEGKMIGVTMPVGWPGRPFGPVNRRPIAEVLHLDRW